MKSMNSMKSKVEFNMILISSLRSILEKPWENNGWAVFFRLGRFSMKSMNSMKSKVEFNMIEEIEEDYNDNNVFMFTFLNSKKINKPYWTR